VKSSKPFFGITPQLPEKYKAIRAGGPFYPVRLSATLRQRQTKMVRLVKEKELGES
jgi:hypothetical protein